MSSGREREWMSDSADPPRVEKRFASSLGAQRINVWDKKITVAV